MARSYRAIQMDFTKANRQARELDGVASKLRSLSGNKMENSLSELAHNWTGDNSAKYIAKGQVLQGNITSTAVALEQVAQAIRDIAETIYDAEMDAWERAHNRD